MAHRFLLVHFTCCSRKSPFIAFNVAFVALVVWKLSDTATNVACAFRCPCLKRTSASKTSTRTIVPSVVRICFPHVNLPKIYPVVTPFTRIAFVNSLALIIAVPFVRKPLSRSRAWRRHGKHGPGISPNIPCPRTCSVSWILCAMTAKRKAPVCNGISSAFSAHNVAPSIRSWSKS
jgi:hypothetical protein